ncbi:DUF805 domain-containing protein [Phaeobacter gallaeciensis]|nr:DUF805 domain-containing protein [Phaeobacter gallaeciensis]
MCTMSLVIFACHHVLPSDIALQATLLTVLFFYFPVTSAGVRRLHDVGESGLLMLEPLKPFLALGVLAVLVWLCVSGTVIGGFVGIFSALYFGTAITIVASIAALVALFLTLASFSTTLGLLFLPSQTGPNKYGPNPHEAPK